MDIALVSSLVPVYPDPDEDHLVSALTQIGVAAEVVGWDDPRMDWSRPTASILRSTWNYPMHHAEFLAWCDEAATRTKLWNPPQVVRWNSHKRYLFELEQRGIPVTPTVALERGARDSLADVLERRGWDDVVVKPAVSASSYKTMRVRPGEGAAGETFLRELLEERDALVQCYLPSVESYGERSLIWIDGELTHSVRKQARFHGDGEFVSPAVIEISSAEASLAARVLATIDEPLLYARIDVAPGPDDHPMLMELELVEPSLFLVQHPPATERFAASIRNRLELG